MLFVTNIPLDVQISIDYVPCSDQGVQWHDASGCNVPESSPAALCGGFQSAATGVSGSAASGQPWKNTALSHLR